MSIEVLKGLVVDGHPLLGQMYWLKLDGESYQLATNGRALTVVRSADPMGDEFPRAESVLEWIENARKESGRAITREQLAAWLADLPVEVTCPGCEGSGRGPCSGCGQDTDCEDCGGEGRTKPDPSPGTVDGREFDRQLVKLALGGLPSERIVVLQSEDRSVPTVFMETGAEWMACVMSYRAETREGAPELFPQSTDETRPSDSPKETP